MPRAAVTPRLTLHRRRYRQQTGPLLEAVRAFYTYPSGENRASGYIDIDIDWVTPIVDDLAELLDVRFTILAFQGYKDGTAGTNWHADPSFDEQAIISLGATRMFGVRRADNAAVHLLEAGDLAYMPSGFQTVWEHRVIPQPDVTGERVSLVFRVPA